MTGVRRRVISGVFAHAYSQAITVVIQVVSVPLFLAYWTPETYGQWLVISAIPAYLTIADFGVLTASANLVTMKVAGGDVKGANRVFSTTLGLLLMAIAAVGSIAIAVILLFPSLIGADKQVALAALTAASLLTVLSGQFDAAYRAYGMYPRITFYLSSVRILEWVGSLIGLLLTRTLGGVAVGLLIGRAVPTVALLAMARAEVPAIPWSLKSFDRGMVPMLLKSGSGFLAMTLSSLFSIQGMLLAVGAAAGPGAAALFGSMRTLTRVLSQLGLLSARSVAPEVSRLHGLGKVEEADTLVRRMRLLVVPLTIAGAAVIALLGPWFVKAWTHGKIAFDLPLLALLLGSATCYAAWQLESVKLTATNCHSKLSIVFVVVAALSVLLATLLVPSMGTVVAAGSAFLADAALLVAAVLLARGANAPRRVEGTR